MVFSLLIEAWIPARRASGRTLTIRPCDITDEIGSDPIVALDWPRPDFQLSSLEFLIGLLATACPPVDHDDSWMTWWKTPPCPAALRDVFTPLEKAFDLDGGGPRFMQDSEAFVGDLNPVETLLIDAPGYQTRKKNADHFVKRDAVMTMSRAAAAMALFTLQSFAPAGGAGNRVGLRGGGPLTTLAVPPWRGLLPLWHLLWANVPTGQPPAANALPSIFPWLSATRTSEAGRITTPADTNVLAAYWGTARRVRLDFSANFEATPCDILAVVDSVVVRGWRQRPHGANYAAWQHPLSPYYRQKPTNTEWLPVHAQPEGVGYRHWVGLLFDDAAEAPMRRAAQAVVTFRANRLFQVAEGGERVRWGLLAAGYDMDNMKARGFVESEMPVIEPGDQNRTGDFVLLLRQLIAGATEAASLLGRAVRRALFSESANVALDAGLFTVIRSRFWEATDTAFLVRVQQAIGSVDPGTVRQAWLRDLARTTRALFAETAPIDASGADHRPDRIAGAARSLNFALNGYGREGEALRRALGLPLPPKTLATGKTAKAKAMTGFPGSQAARWWRELQPTGNQGERRSGDRCALARLRRCTTTMEAASEPATLALCRWLGTGESSLDRVALLAAVLAHVQEEHFDLTVARQIGVQRNHAPTMSELRFRSLVQADGLDDQLIGFRRLVTLAGRRVNVADLADGLWHWGHEPERRRWIYAYHDAPNFQTGADATPSLCEDASA